ncbi:1-deoxy-D-xylulose-5-phosphate reductoisomerase [Hydrogenophaga sp. 5NK40-0174]|uniref:1-deoxy-D-xylulose-5-phosphate reductoisomerase n=1 Tax=Hydrogenophaga sp. 5NK40-0174 TaxID=3127649 RepID=UPI003103EDC9
MSAIETVAVLGSTGSIGTNTLDVVARHPERYRVFALTAARQDGLMLKQIKAFSPSIAVMQDQGAADRLREAVRAEGLATEVLCGTEPLCEVASAPEVDAVMAAIVGAAGLAPSLAAARAGKKLLLANKEALVVGGGLFMEAVRRGGATLLPIDSEHSAIFQSLPDDAATWERRVQKIILTASGGPFRQRDPATLSSVTPEEACAHPNWDMGRKISVDSATMMNKGLEVIEAHHLFSMPGDRIEVVIHPQSVVHSMVQFHDASIVAQLGTPDMRVPIAYGLSWPERMTSGAAPLDFTAMGSLTFEPPSFERFPCLRLAWNAMEGAEGSTAVLNAANEEAVGAFLDRQLRFDQIYRINLATLEGVLPSNPRSVEDLMALDGQARAFARNEIDNLKP